MTAQRKWEIGAAAVVLTLVVVFLRGWMLERDARNDAEKAARADEKKVSQAQEAIQHRDADAADLRKQLAGQAAAVTTPQAAGKVIVRYVSAYPHEPIGPEGESGIPVIEKAELPADVQSKLPNAPSYAVLTDLQAEDVAKLQLACDADRHELQACHADVGDLRAEMAAQSDEAKHWEAAAKGGTKWQRFGRVLKFAACAGGGAAAGQFVDRSARAAAIGGAAAIAGCSLFKP